MTAKILITITENDETMHVEHDLQKSPKGQEPTVWELFVAAILSKELNALLDRIEHGE